MKPFIKKILAVAFSLSLTLGLIGVVGAAVKTGTDISSGKSWSSYSIHTREDDGEWEDALIADGQSYMNEDDAYKSYGENATITTSTASSFTMDVTSTGWSANWGPSGETDSDGNAIYEVKQSNPWGVTATKIVNVERGRYYKISFKIKSTLSNEITETVERSDGTAYNEGTGVYNYIKHIHFKVYDNKDDSGAALDLLDVTATIGGSSVLTTGKKINSDFDPFISLDSTNTDDDGWVTVTATVVVPADKSDYQSSSSQATMGFKFAFGAFLYEYPDENNMSGTIQVKDFTIKASYRAPAKVTIKKVTAKKKKVTIKFKKSARASQYEVQVSLNKNFTKKKTTTKTTKKKTITIKKLKSGKTYYVRVRGKYKKGGYTVYGAYSKVKKVKVK